nr:hypothetical protein [uncultured Campylobacter sp.]
MQKHPHNTGIGKGLGGIFIDKHAHTGFAWTKDKLGMYHGEARLGAARMGRGIASVRVSKPKAAPPFVRAMNTACMR